MINLNTAAALDLTLPPALAGLAGKVIAVPPLRPA
jgi:hypothetical protein